MATAWELSATRLAACAAFVLGEYEARVRVGRPESITNRRLNARRLLQVCCCNCSLGAS